ncbi:MAG: hypothetical protein HYX61_11355 [Gammaproteobacteria bacterium]|jgi:hypothetical protein|nr:hypothetical protein [Gammaproteobacteria bacterium]
MLGSLSTPKVTENVMTPEEKRLLDELSLTTDPLNFVRERAQNVPYMHFLFFRRYLGIAHYLSNLGLSLEINATNANGESLVHFIAERKDVDWLLWFLMHSNKDLFLKTKTKQNIFHYSAHITEPGFLEPLFSLSDISAHTFCFNALDQSPLDLAIEYDNEIFFAYYLLNFHNQTLGYIHPTTGQNIMHLIAKHNAVKCYEMLKTKLTNVDLFALETDVDNDKMTPCDIAEQNAADDDRHKIFHLMMGYVKGNLETLEWKVALATVTRQLEQCSIATQASTESTDPANQTTQDPLASLLNTVPHLDGLLHHAFNTLQTRSNTESYQQEICDQQEDEYPESKIRHR